MGNVILVLAALLIGFLIAWLFKSVRTVKVNREAVAANAAIAAETDRLVRERKEKIASLDEETLSRMAQLDKIIQEEASIAQTVLDKETERAREAFAAYVEGLDFQYAQTEEEFDAKKAKLLEELEKLRATRIATIEAALREKEVKEKENFYRIPVSEIDLQDILLLEEIKPKLRKPEVLSKLIWTTYYQKGLNTLCNNVVGAGTVCGIYKITDQVTSLVYIGQSVNISQRWKDHVKAALGASGTASSNKLYSAMQESGVHNFTFEVLEVVPSSQLNEKEKYYIDLYQSAAYGLNTVKGIG